MDPKGISRDLAHKRFSGQVRRSKFETIDIVIILIGHNTQHIQFKVMANFWALGPLFGKHV